VLDLRQPHWAQGFAALPHDLYFWLALLTGVMAVALAFHYVCCADRLVALIDMRFPELWENLRPRGKPVFYALWRRVYRVDNLILCGSGQEFHPDSSDFRRLLLAARWAITGFLLDFLVFTVALAQIKPVF
jgi:hypothetical protein